MVLSPGGCIILLIAGLSTLVIIFRPLPGLEGQAVWIYTPRHAEIYKRELAQWNRLHPDNRAHLGLFEYHAFQRRLLSGFLAGTPVGDLIEVERNMIGPTFTGTFDDVGFVDLTDHLRDEGLLEQINAPSFSPWTSHGRIFGIPHDVHPVLLAYRADLVEAAGIDVSKIETWDDFYRVLSPLIKDLDGDGRPDRFLLNLSTSPLQAELIEALLLQAGGELFDGQKRPVLDSELNAHVLARLATWLVGPRRMCVDAPENTAAGDAMRVRGTVIASVMPDWLAGAWKQHMPTLSGKIKLMPLPAWEKGGRHTTVLGGTMIGIAKTAPDFEKSWAIAKYLYLSPQSAEALFRGICIISPVKSNWSLPVYHQPDPFFCGQKIGELFIAQAPDVPLRSSSPYNTLALEKFDDALVSLCDYATRENRYDAGELEPEARRLLGRAQADMERLIARNVFLASQP